jgi:hypothetical protein
MTRASVYPEEAERVKALRRRIMQARLDWQDRPRTRKDKVMDELAGNMPEVRLTVEEFCLLVTDPIGGMLLTEVNFPTLYGVRLLTK